MNAMVLHLLVYLVPAIIKMEELLWLADKSVKTRDLKGAAHVPLNVHQDPGTSQSRSYVRSLKHARKKF